MSEECCPTCQGEGVVQKPIRKTRAGGGGVTCDFCKHENCETTIKYDLWNWKLKGYTTYMVCTECFTGLSNINNMK